MLTFAQKQEAVLELRERFTRANSLVIADYRGLSVQAVDALRAALHDRGGADFEYRVVKNSVMRRAVQGQGFEALAEHVQGPTALALCYGDPVGMAKALIDFVKDNEAFELRGGMVSGKPVALADIEALAKLPGLEEVRGTLVGLLSAPARGLAALLQAPGAQIARLASARSSALSADAAS